MAFPLPLASALTGVTKSQLRLWHQKGLVVPEIKKERPPTYSMRDLILLRAVARLRCGISLQRISKAFKNLSAQHVFEHPSEFRFGTDGKTIYVELHDHTTVDILQNPGQGNLFTFEELSQPFLNFRGESVVDFRKPRPNLSVDARRLGGWPTIDGTRVRYDLIASVVDGVSITEDTVGEFYSGVTPEAARDAISLNEQVEAIAA